MSAPRQGSLEIDQTLRLARDAIERDIARYRVGVFVVVVLITSVLRLTGLSDTWVPTLFFAGATVYALLVRGFLARYGNPPALAIVALVADLGVSAACFQFMRHHASPAQRVDNVAFTTYILGPAMVLVAPDERAPQQHEGCPDRRRRRGGPLRRHRSDDRGFHPAQVSVATILLLAGIVGMASARQARKNLDNFARLQLLRRYLPPEAVERVMRHDPDAALAPGGRLVTVTLLAADLRGFTAMSENLSPSEVMAQLNAYHGAMIDVIERHGGAIDKFIGDGTLVVFGLSGPADDAATSAVECAEAMLDALAAHNRERARVGAPALAMGIAVHTGPVIAGNLGAPGRRLEFTVIGDAVNTVSRLEGQTKASGTPVIVSAETAALLPNTSRLRELAPVSLRGKVQPMRVFGLASTPTTPPLTGG